MIPLLLAAALAAPVDPDVVVVVASPEKDVLRLGFGIGTPIDHLRAREAVLLKGWKPSADGSDPLDRLVPEGHMWRVERPGPSPHAEALTAALAKALDTNGDGVISDGELKVAATVLLAKFDADGDDCLTPLEIVPDLLTRPPGKRGAVPRVEVVDRLEGFPVWAFLVPIKSLATVAPIPPDRGVEVVGVLPNPFTVPATPMALLRPGREAERKRFEAVAKEVVTITVRPEPRGWFEVFDANGDGQLSVRELRDAKAVLTARGEQVVRGPDYSVPAVTVIVSAGTSGPPPVRLTKAPPPQRGPQWFRALDRNGDGDVSRKEFSGTDAQFKQYDADGDGLISADEAVVGDTKLKPGGKP